MKQVSKIFTLIMSITVLVFVSPFAEEVCELLRSGASKRIPKCMNR